MRDRNPSSFKAGCMADFNPGHYSFSRTSGLPRGYFDESNSKAKRCGGIALIATFICSVVLLPFIL